MLQSPLQIAGAGKPNPILSNVALSPGPMPKLTRPPDTSSIVAIALAVNNGFRVKGFVMPVPGRMVDVFSDMSVSIG
jgi:hypothetical protein